PQTPRHDQQRRPRRLLVIPPRPRTPTHPQSTLREQHHPETVTSPVPGWSHTQKISHEQSRRNAARRRRRVAGRHALAGPWGQQASPMFGAGPVAYEIGGNVDATCFGGVAAVHRLVTKLGLPDRINDEVSLLRVHLPYHESDHVLNLAYNVLTGGTRLEDIERLRHDTAYMNALGADLIPDP